MQSRSIPLRSTFFGSDEFGRAEIDERCRLLLRENPWWLRTIAAAGGDVTCLTPLRDLGGELLLSPLWALAPGSSTLKAGQFGVALVLADSERYASAHHNKLVAALGAWRRFDCLADVAALRHALMPLFIAWAKALGLRPRCLDEVPQLLWEANEVLPWERACHGDSPDALREAARAVEAWRHETAHLGHYRLGVWHAAHWCALSAHASRFEAVLLAQDCRRLCRDLIATAVIGAWRITILTKGRESVRSLPDPSVMKVLRLPRAPAESGVSAYNASPSSDPFDSVEAPSHPAPAPAPMATSADESAQALEQRVSSEAWWEGVCRWSAARDRDPGPLLELALALERRPLWPLVAAELKRAEPSLPSIRLHQRSRFILALVLDEFMRARPRGLPALLDDLLPPDEVIYRFEHCARFENAYAVVFEGWATTLARKRLSGAAIPKQLNRCARIVPWDDLSRLDEAGRRARQDEAIDQAFQGVGASADDIWRGVYWAAIRVRNDEIHAMGHSLRGRVRPTDLRLDMLLFHGLGALRFRMALARRRGELALTLPSITCL